MPASFRRTALRLALLPLLAVPVAAQPAPPVLTFTAVDFAFRGAPTSARAGVTTIRLVNEGTKLHHVQLVRLGEGKTLRDLLGAWQAKTPFPAWATGVGGPTAAWRGQTIEATVVLEPGRYGVVCWVPAPDGQLHLMKGMMAQFEVTGAVPAGAALPPGDVTVELFDYNFTVSRGGFARGPTAIRIENRGPQVHEFVFVKLAPGKRATDAARWAEGGQVSDPPGEMIAGVSGLAPGRAAVVRHRFTPGTYAMLCFTPDARGSDHRAHAELGMVKEIVVR